MTRLVIFDVDGTLVDSQKTIVEAMTSAFVAQDLPPPGAAAVLGIVGLSLDDAMLRLAPDQPAVRREALVAGYRAGYRASRERHGAVTGSPLYDGVAALLATLAADPDVMLGIATGKSRRGLTALLEGHGLTGAFVTTQVADDHPGKPHPAMILAAMAEANVGPAATVMVGDTTFDMDMARAAGVEGIGVPWGYHAPELLRGRARRMVRDVAELTHLLTAHRTETA